MFIVWGSRGYQKRLGETEGLVHCEHCNNDVHYAAVEIGRRSKPLKSHVVSRETTRLLVCLLIRRGITTRSLLSNS